MVASRAGQSKRGLKSLLLDLAYPAKRPERIRAGRRICSGVHGQLEPFQREALAVHYDPVKVWHVVAGHSVVSEVVALLQVRIGSGRAGHFRSRRGPFNSAWRIGNEGVI